MRLIIAIISIILSSGSSLAQVRLTGAVLPTVRSVPTQGTATIFGTVINYGLEEGQECFPTIHSRSGTVAMDFEYQALNLDLSPLADTNTPVAIPAGGAQTFLLVFRSPDHNANSFRGAVQYVCGDVISSNRPLLSEVSIRSVRIDAEPEPDIIAIGATSSADQIVRGNNNGVGVMAVAAVNIGVEGTVYVKPVVRFLPTNNGNGDNDRGPVVDVSICETDSSARCLHPASNIIETFFETNQVRTYNIYYRNHARDGVPFLPESLRLFVDFGTHSPAPGYVSQIVGSTSAAVSVAADHAPEVFGIWSLGRYPDMGLNERHIDDWVLQFPSELIVMPRPEPWASEGPLAVITQRRIDLNRRGDLAIPIWDFDVLAPTDRGFQFEPEAADIDFGYFRGNRDGDVLTDQTFFDSFFNIRASLPGAGISGRFIGAPDGLIECPDDDAADDCNSNGVRTDYWNSRLEGMRIPDRNEGFSIERLVTLGAVRQDYSQGGQLEITADGTVRGIVQFPLMNSNELHSCRFEGQVFDTLPGAAAFYVRLTIVESNTSCDTLGMTARPNVGVTYEGIMIVSSGNLGLNWEGGYSHRGNEYRFVLRSLTQPFPATPDGRHYVEVRATLLLQ
jgi:hypothetical protein